MEGASGYIPSSRFGQPTSLSQEDEDLGKEIRIEDLDSFFAPGMTSRPDSAVSDDSFRGTPTPTRYVSDTALSTQKVSDEWSKLVPIKMEEPDLPIPAAALVPRRHTAPANTGGGDLTTPRAKRSGKVATYSKYVLQNGNMRLTEGKRRKPAGLPSHSVIVASHDNPPLPTFTKQFDHFVPSTVIRPDSPFKSIASESVEKTSLPTKKLAKPIPRRSSQYPLIEQFINTRIGSYYNPQVVYELVVNYRGIKFDHLEKKDVYTAEFFEIHRFMQDPDGRPSFNYGELFQADNFKGMLNPKEIKQILAEYLEDLFFLSVETRAGLEDLITRSGDDIFFHSLFSFLETMVTSSRMHQGLSLLCFLCHFKYDSRFLNVLMCHFMVKLGFYKNAIDNLKIIIERHPEISYAYALQAECLFHLGKLEDASESLEPAFERRPECLYVRTLSGIIDSYDSRTLSKELEEVIEAYPSYSFAIALRAEYFFYARSYTSSYRDYCYLYNLYPNFTFAYNKIQQLQNGYINIADDRRI